MAQGVVRAGLIAFGVGISDCLHTARSLLEGGAQMVVLVYCVRLVAEAVLRDEIEALQRDFPERFAVRYFLSRESPATVTLDGAVCGRLDRAALEVTFGEWAKAGRARGSAFLVVGTRAMNRQTYGLLAEIGLPRLLCGFRGTEPPEEIATSADAEDKLL